MFNQYEPNVKATCTILRLLRVRVNKSTVNETLQNHPEWPSLLCISDSLSKWNIPNAAGKIDVNQIDHLPIPFIAYSNDQETPLSIVSQISEKTIHTYSKNYNKPVSQKREDFLKKWNGTYLIVEPSEKSGESNYELNRRKSIINSLIPISGCIVFVILSLLFLRRVMSSADITHSVVRIGVYLQYLILLAGIIVTSLLLWYEIDKSNPVLQKVCTAIANGNCNAIVTGKHAKVFNWLSWSEVGFFYFTGWLLVLLFAENTIANSIALIAWVGILALPYAVFSIYYQWRVAKQWCMLCLAVQVLLILGGINFLANGFLTPFPRLTAPFLLKAELLCLLPVLIWYALKPSILRLQEAKNTKREYLRIKFNVEIFETLLKKQKAFKIPADGLGIDLGNPEATNTLIKVCNPYCGPCAKAHPKIEELLEQNANVKAKIIFTTPNDEAHRALKPTSHLMAIAASSNETITKHALQDWYLTDINDYEQFAAKYPMNGDLVKQGHKIEAMDKWCKAIDISFTPTIFINGYQLPDAYSIEDLQYFLLEPSHTGD